MATTELFATGVGLLIGCVFFRDTLDPRRVFNLPVKVNCWFCCRDARVPYRSRKAWTCPREECSQYNGFNHDGGYNREIAEQHNDPDETVGGRTVRYAQKIPIYKNTNGLPVIRSKEEETNNGLCRTCNLNQDLKIHQLRNFVARNDDDYDQEVQEFAAHLERTYRLCRYCEASLHQRLGEQDSWLKPKLLGWKLERNRQSPLSSSKTGFEGYGVLATICSQLLRIAILIGAVFVCFLACSAALPFKKLRELTDNSLWSDLSILLWLRQNVLTRIPIHLTFNGQVYLLSDCRQDWMVIFVFLFVLPGFCYFHTIIHDSLLHKGCLASWIILVINVIIKERQILSIPESILAIAASICLITSLIVCVLGFVPSKTRRQNQNKFREFRNERLQNLGQNWQWSGQRESVLDDTLTQDLVSTSTPVGSVMNSTCSSVAQSQIAMSTVAPSRFNPFNNSNLIEHESSILPQHEIYQHKSKTNASERHCDISKLHIDSNQIKAIGRDLSNCDTISVASGAFSLKQYDCLNNSGIDFGHLGSKQHCSGKGPLVKPPRFTGNSSNRKGVAKSSWVAGGYWLNNKYQQNKTFITKAVSGNRDLPENISRSSSQSSGFVSYSSQLPVPRPDSFLNNSNIPLKKGEFTSNISSIGTNEKFETMRKEGGFHHILSEPPHKLNKAKSGSSFSLNPIGDQLAFFDTSTSTNGGNSRPCSPTFLFSKDDQNEFPNQTRTFSRMSKHFISLNECNEKEPDNSSFNSSLDRLTQEAFSELQPKAESSPKILGINKCDNDCPAKTWMEQKITINISLYSAILFISFAVNVALTIYYMS